MTDAFVSAEYWRRVGGLAAPAYPFPWDDDEESDAPTPLDPNPPQQPLSWMELYELGVNALREMLDSEENATNESFLISSFGFVSGNVW